MYFGAGLINAAWRSDQKYRPIGEYQAGRIVAMDPATNRIAWQKTTQWSLSAGNGMLTAAGGVMFIGQPDGYLVASTSTTVVNCGASKPERVCIPHRSPTRSTVSSTNNHCADSFFEHEFDSGVLEPGQTFSFAFNTAGEYFYNDCVWPEATGKIVVQ